MNTRYRPSQLWVWMWALGLAFAGWWLHAAPGVRPVRSDSRFGLRLPADEGQLIARRAGMTMRTLSKAERLRAAALRDVTRSGDGGGGALANLTVTQTAYLNSDCPGSCEGNPCNVILLLWEESFPINPGVEVYFDGAHLGTVNGLFGTQLPGVNGVQLGGFPSGTHMLRVRSTGDGTSSEATFTQLDTQPFGDPRNLSCIEGPVDGQGTCEMRIAFEHPAVRPEGYAILLDGVFLGTFPSDGEPSRKISFAPAGERCVTLVGFSEDNKYQGCRVESCCTLACVPEGCLPPGNLILCQLTYAEESRAVQAFWSNPVAYTKISAFKDAAFAGDFPGDTTALEFQFINSDQAMIGIQGTCGDESSTVTEDILPLLDQTPHTHPVMAPPTCDYNDHIGDTTVTWENADPSFAIILFVLTDSELFFLGYLPGSTESVTVLRTQPDYIIYLQFLSRQGNHCYGSDLVECIVPGGPGYRAGICNGSAALDISSPIFLLGFLFSGGGYPALSCSLQLQWGRHDRHIRRHLHAELPLPGNREARGLPGLPGGPARAPLLPDPEL